MRKVAFFFFNVAFYLTAAKLFNMIRDVSWLHITGLWLAFLFWGILAGFNWDRVLKVAKLTIYRYNILKQQRREQKQAISDMQKDLDAHRDKFMDDLKKKMS